VLDACSDDQAVVRQRLQPFGRGRWRRRSKATDTSFWHCADDSRQAPTRLVRRTAPRYRAGVGTAARHCEVAPARR